MNYTYEITRVDAESKSMDIQYTSAEHGTVLVGARMPWDGETLENVVKAFAPTRYWAEKVAKVAKVAAGESGTITEEVVEDVPNSRTTSKLNLVRRMREIELEADKGNLWAAFKGVLKTADENTVEDWQMAVDIDEDDPVFVAIMTSICDAEAPSMITSIFDSDDE